MFFDIVSLAQAYSFNWREMIFAAKSKQVLDDDGCGEEIGGIPKNNCSKT